MKLNKEQIYHLIDLLDIDIEKYKSNHSSKRLLSDSQKQDGIDFNQSIINLLDDMQDEN